MSTKAERRSEDQRMKAAHCERIQKDAIKWVTENLNLEVQLFVDYKVRDCEESHGAGWSHSQITTPVIAVGKLRDVLIAGHAFRMKSGATVVEGDISGLYGDSSAVKYRDGQSQIANNDSSNNLRNA